MIGLIVFIAALWFFLCAWRWYTFAPLLPLFLPMYLLRVDVFGVPFTVLEVLVGMTFIVWLMRWLASKEEWHFIPRPLRFWLGFFLLAGTIGLVAAPQTVTMIDGTIFPSATVALGIWKGWVVMGVFAGVVFAGFLREERTHLRALYAWFGGGFFVSLCALAQVWSGVFLTPDGRASGPFMSANYLSLYIGPMIVAVFGLVIDTKERHARAALLTLLLTLSAALFFSKSYAAWLAVAGCLGFYAVLRFIFLAGGKPRYRLLAWSGGIVGLALAVMFFLERHSEKLQQLFAFTERSSSAVRLEVWQIALQLIREHPLVGIGLGQFQAFYQVNAVRILGHAPYEWVMLHPHNLFLAMWLFTGVLGFLWLCWVVARVCVAGYRAIAIHHQRLPVRRLIVLFVCVFLTVIVHGFFDTPVWKNDLMVSFWFILVFLFSLR